MPLRNYNHLIPHKISGLQKCRVGGPNDGGYVCPIQIGIDSLLSYGIGGDISFEKKFAELYSPSIACFDHTIDKLPEEADFQFFKEPLVPGAIDLHIEKFGWKDRKLAVKVDTEGAEWESLRDVKSWDQVLLLVAELHNICEMPRPMLSELSQHFVCYHVHGNNFCGTSYSKYPNTIEATFVSRRYAGDGISVDNDLYPTPFDHPNGSNSPDLVCDWWK